MSTDKLFLNFAIDSELLEKVDDYRFKKRFESRAEAVRHLIQRGLEAEGEE